MCLNAVDKSSRPLFSVIAVLLFAPLAYINVVAAGDTVCALPSSFTQQALESSPDKPLQSTGSLLSPVSLPSSHGWLSALSSMYPSYYDQCRIAHFSPYSIRFRAAWKYHGHSLEELPFRALGGVWGSWFGILLLSLVLIAQFYVVCCWIYFFIYQIGSYIIFIRRSGRSVVYPLTPR